MVSLFICFDGGILRAGNMIFRLMIIPPRYRVVRTDGIHVCGGIVSSQTLP